MKAKLFGAAALLGLAFTSVATAATIYESATLGPFESHGYALSSGGASSQQWLGSRFTLSATTNITAVGGNIGGAPSTTLFGAIISLPSVSALPSFAPLDLPSNVLGYAVFSAPSLSADLRISLSLTLGAGTYALIFGTGLFGAVEGSGDPGFMPSNNDDLAGASYFDFQFGVWNDNAFSDARFVVEGDVVPLPATLPLFATGLGALGLLGWRRKRKQSATA